MKSINLILILTTLFFFQDKSFINKILNDFDRNSRFVCINIMSSTYRGEVVIENDDLYLYFNKILGFDVDNYKSYIQKNIHNKIDLGSIDLNKWNFCKVGNTNEKYKYNKISLEKIKLKYFDNGKAIKEGISDKSKNLIISLLFKLEKSCYIDDETGYLVLD